MIIAAERPRFSFEEARTLVFELYQLKALSIEALPSERDQNFLLETEQTAFVLKIANPGESLEILDFQNKAMAHLAAFLEEMPCPRVIPTVSGEEITRISGPGDLTYLVRLVTYLPGVPLGEVKPHTPELLADIGRSLGRLDQALGSFSHAAMQRALHWDMKHAAKVIRQHFVYITDPTRRQLVEHFLGLFEAQVTPLLPELRQSIIHNDANDYNILIAPVNRHGTGFELRPVTGLIDFGDMVETHTVFEPAIACAYVMLNKTDPLAAAAQLIQGYHEQHPLTEPELEILFILIGVRLCTSVCLSAYQQQMEPENEYLSISEKPAWLALARLVEIHPRFGCYVFRHACGLPPCPQTAGVVQWLQTQQGQFAPVVGLDLKTAPNVVFDLSVGSPMLAQVADSSDTAALSEYLFSRMQSAGAVVGIGRYNEARQIYTSDLFTVENAAPRSEFGQGRTGLSDEPDFEAKLTQSPSPQPSPGGRGGFASPPLGGLSVSQSQFGREDGGEAGPLQERRTIHLGLDLFMAAGSPVFAPLDGKVHSFHDNAAPQDYGPTIILEHQAGEATFYTLYGHLSEESLTNIYEGMPVKKGDRLAAIGDFPINGDWPPHLHFQIIVDLLDREGEFPGVALAGQREVWLSLCPDPNLILGIPATCFPPEEMSRDEILKGRRAHLGRSLSVSYKKPLKIVRGWRQYLYDQTGRAYLDAVNNVPHVGHCHPQVVKAGQQQMAVLNTNTRYLHDDLVRYAERLCATMPDPLNVCFFVCSGSEANDLALRLARTHTGHHDIITVEGGYHGNLSSLVEISPYKFDGPGGSGAPPHVHKVIMPDPYRGPYQAGDPDAGRKYAGHVKMAVDQAQANGSQVAAFFCESVLGCGGQVVLPPGYLEAAYRHVRDAGGVCVADEVQVGFGRVGTHFWGFETQGVAPDIVTLGKPMGNGHPLAAVATTPEIAESFANGMEYFNTFGGNPVSCAIGLAVLDVIEAENLQQNALYAGNRLLAGLERLKLKHEIIGDVRGLGLFVGIELVLDRETLAPAAAQAGYIANRMCEHGILISTDGPLHNVLKIKPPLVFSEADAHFLVSTLDGVLEEDFVKRTD